MPKVSITTATFNSGATLARTIESVLAQTYGNIEYIVMDGGSTDSTLVVAEAYREAFEFRGMPYRVVSEPDGGMYDAINKAMAMATGELLGNVNSDDYLEPGGVESVVRAYLERPFDVAYADLRIHTGRGSFVKRARPMRPWPTTRKWNHPTMFLAGEALQLRYGTDNPYADFDLFLRALSLGLEVRTLPVVVSNFTFGGMSTRKSWSDVRKRIGWKVRVFRDNGCPPMTYVEGVLTEVAKYVAA